MRGWCWWKGGFSERVVLMRGCNPQWDVSGRVVSVESVGP